MNVMHIIDSAGIYGAEMMLLNLMEEQKQIGPNPLLLSIESFDDRKEPSLSDEASKRKLSVVKYQSGRGYSWTMARDIMHLAKQREVSIIHSHGYKGNILIGSTPSFMRCAPVISTVHGWTSIKRFTKMWGYVLLDKFFLKRMDAVVAVTPATALLTKTTAPFVISNGLPSLHFTDINSLTKTDSVISDFCRDGFIIGVISRLSEEKGLTYLIDAMQNLVSQGNNFKAIIIGEGPEREHLQNLVRRNNLSKNILFAGYRPYAFNYLPFFNIFILPSLTEGLPITILECMQAKIPVIATKVGGIPELLDYGRCGLLVEPGNAKAIADAIIQLYSDTTLAKRLAAAAYDEVLSKYSSRTMAEQYLSLYKAVIRKWHQR